MSSFFTVPASQRKRKRPDGASTQTSRKRTTGTRPSQPARPAGKRQQEKDDESISGSESDDASSGFDDVGAGDGSDTSESAAGQTAAERRLKLAEQYLDNIREEVADGGEVGFDAEDVDRDLIAARLKQDVDEEQGKLYNRIALKLDLEKTSQTQFRADTLATTGVAACPPYLYTVSKDRSLIRWELPAMSPQAEASRGSSYYRKKPKQLRFTRGSSNNPEHHDDKILCVAASTSGKFVVTGGADRKLIIWDPLTLKPLKIFTQHRDAVTAVAFRGKTHQLFSASADRTVKIWSLDELAYVETLFGHQDSIADVAAAAGSQERCVSVGSQDRSARLWKVVEESQLVFRGGGTEISFPETSLDRVIQPTTQLFITGSDSGSLSLFSLHKKKPQHVVHLAHGYDHAPPLSSWSAEADPTITGASAKALQKYGPQPTPRGITALASIPGSDLFVSGSWDGYVRVWRIADDLKSIEALGVLQPASVEPPVPTPQTIPAAAAAAAPVMTNATTATIAERSKPARNGASTEQTSPAVSAATTTTSDSSVTLQLPPDAAKPQIAEDAALEKVAGPIRGVINDLAVFERTSNAGAPPGKAAAAAAAAAPPPPAYVCWRGWARRRGWGGGRWWTGAGMAWCCMRFRGRCWIGVA